jgi:sterol 24-C-methyltransferase
MTPTKDKRADSSDYLKHWQTRPGVNDAINDLDSRERRRENYDKLANECVDFKLTNFFPLCISLQSLSLALTFLSFHSFYDNSTDFYLEGWGQSFHFCRYPRGREPVPQAMARHEHYLASHLNIHPGMKVLDVGCGIGGPAKEIAAFLGCKVIGININGYQIEKGKEFAKKEGVGEDTLEFVRGDFAVSRIDKHFTAYGCCVSQKSSHEEARDTSR